MRECGGVLGGGVKVKNGETSVVAAETSSICHTVFKWRGRGVVHESQCRFKGF